MTVNLPLRSREAQRSHPLDTAKRVLRSRGLWVATRVTLSVGMVLGFLSIDVGAHQTSAWRTVELISLAVVAASLALQSYALCVRGREWMVRLREK